MHSLVIGGTRGLGRVVARLLGESGHRVSSIGRREAGPEDAVANVRRWRADFSDEAVVGATLREVIATLVRDHVPLRSIRLRLAWRERWLGRATTVM